ncbi:UDP-glycosyltransferase UGT5 [Leptinotarsa decemlineata]|uniref:UDP-glycosyltransferase UGT5 n=1 Tax=Leptinotarsa decemlineata TaxID=7539 RepID=UPI003D30C18D
MNMKTIHYIIFLHAMCLGNTYKILVMFPVPSPSHFILGSALARGLVNAGHDVTIVSPYKDKNPTENGKYSSIVLKGLADIKDPLENIKLFEIGESNPLTAAQLMYTMGNEVTNSTLESINSENSNIYEEKFDLVILEYFKNDALLALACHLKTPLVLFSTMGANLWVNSLVGNPTPPSYIPDLHLSYTDNMDFWQRLMNVFMYSAKKLNDKFFFLPFQYELAKKHFPHCVGEEGPLSNVSLLLLNSHESVNNPVPLVPNMINIGGFHISPQKELPRDLKEYIDNAEEGVVYFSLGSNVKPSEMRNETKKALLNALGKIKQKVLWKWDEDFLPGNPENIRTNKWFPQQEILAHPNVKVFITHGGLLSTTETIYHGVPILALPIFGDQKMNAAHAVAGGYALSLSISKITEDDISDALNQLLNDPKYRENAKKRSALMHDRQVKPMDLAIYWIEYVIRNKGAPHLRVAALNLTWYQYLLLDIISVVLIIGIILMFVSYLLMKKLCLSRKSDMKIKSN